MRMTTHVAFGLGLAGLLSSYAGCSMDCWILSLIVSASINLIVDLIGHRSRLMKPPVRTRVTHSLPGIVVLSLAVSYVTVRGIILPPRESFWLYVIGVVSGLSHWLLDALNPGGVYIVRRRFRLARIPYYSLLWNTALQMLGGAMLLYSLTMLYK